MKLLKKLSEEWTDNNYGGEGPTDVVEQCVKDAYEAGFRKAKEMSIACCKEIQLRSYIDKVSQPGAMSVEKLIELIGEKG